MWSVRDWLRALGLDHRNPGNNDPREVDQKFRDYNIRKHKLGPEELKPFGGFRDDWRQKFGHESRRDFEAPDEEQERHRQRQEYAAKTIEQMMQEQEDAEKNRQGTPWGGYTRSTGGQESASGSDSHRPADAAGRAGSHQAASSGQPAGAAEAEAPRQGDAACPNWPHISDKKMNQHRQKLSEQRLGEYIFLYCCQEQCINCCLRCLQEFAIDPKHCESTGRNGIEWAAENQGGVSAEFRKFWEGLTSETVWC